LKVMPVALFFFCLPDFRQPHQRRDKVIPGRYRLRGIVQHQCHVTADRSKRGVENIRRDLSLSFATYYACQPVHPFVSHVYRLLSSNVIFRFPRWCITPSTMHSAFTVPTLTFTRSPFLIHGTSGASTVAVIFGFPRSANISSASFNASATPSPVP